MTFTKRFGVGLIMVFVGILTAFNYVSTYRTIDILLFFLGMASALTGTVMMFRGIEAKKTNP